MSLFRPDLQEKQSPESLGNREDLRGTEAVSQETCQTLYRSILLRATSNWLYALIDPRTAEDPFLRPLAAALVQRFFH